MHGIFDVVCMGTSLTDSWSARNWTYEAQCALQLGKKERVRFVANAKIGQTSRWGFENIGATAVLRPRAVLMEFNMNDSAHPDGANPYDIIDLGEAYTYTVGMIDAIRAARADTLIWLMTMNPPNSINGQDQWRGSLPQYNAQYAAIAAEKGVGLIDNYPQWVARGPSQLLIDVPDGSHPRIEALREVLIPNVVNALSPYVK